MVILVLGALLAGGLASLVLPFLPFAVALLLAAAIGAIWTALQTHALGAAALEAVLLMGATQIGYAFGLVGLAAADRRSGAAAHAAGRGTDQPGVRDLRFEEKP